MMIADLALVLVGALGAGLYAAAVLW